MNNEKNTITAENAENLNGTITTRVDIFKRKPRPVMEYGRPVLFCIENIDENEKREIVQGQNEHEPDTERVIIWYTITGHLISQEYGTTGESFKFNVFGPLMDRITLIAHEQNTLIFSAVFEPVRYEWTDEKTAEKRVTIKPDLLTAERLTPEEIRAIKKHLK